MNKTLSTLFAVLACAALSLPVCAQDEGAVMDAPPQGGQTQTDQPQEDAAAGQVSAGPSAAPAAAKSASKNAAGKKKKKAKKKKVEPVSEYKFSSGEPTTTYKFDKKADPILKKTKKKKTSGKKGGTVSSGSTVTPKLQKVKTFEEEQEAQKKQANPLAGMNIPGMGGN